MEMNMDNSRADTTMGVSQISSPPPTDMMHYPMAENWCYTQVCRANPVSG